MSTSPLQKLELQALEQRIRLHEVFTDAKIQVKEKLDLNKNLRKHLLAGTVTACVIGLSLGYSSADMMITKTKKRKEVKR
ncbi:MAG: hypothetical protein M3O09_03665 [Acidobacteriota bacterium]|nr:hypothetical protein [Acidobacteriota bacterium]